MPHQFRELKVWQRGMDLAVDVYRFSQSFPKEEVYALTSQLRRAISSVPLNIAEGAGCRTDPEFVQFLGIAYRSCNEVVTAMELSVRLGYAKRAEADKLISAVDEQSSMLMGLMRTITEQKSKY